ncbi:MAG: WD40 repeat domain-containing protein [Gemmataceae bacterium]
MLKRRLGSVIALAFFALVGLAVPFLPAANEELPPGLVLTLKGHKEAVYSITYSPDGKFLVTGSGDPSVKVWDATTGKELKTFAGPNGHKGLILSLAVAPDGSQFATAAADNSARVWDFPGSKSLRDYAMESDPRAVAVSPDGTRAAGGGKDGAIVVWNSADGKTLHTLKGHTGAVTSLAFSPNNQMLVSAGEDATLRFWNTSDGKSLASYAAHPGAVRAVAFNPGGNVVYTTGADGTLRFWSMPPTGTRNLQTPFAAAIQALALSPDGSQVLTGSGKQVRQASVSTGQTGKEYTSRDEVSCVATPSGTAYVAAGTTTGMLQVWQNKDGKTLLNQPVHTGSINAVAFQTGTSLLATAGKDGMVRVLGVPTNPPRVVSHGDIVRAAAISPDGLRLATGGNDKTIRLFRMDNLKQPERQLTGQPGPILHLKFSGDGKALASAGEDGVLRLWHTDKSEPTHLIGAHTAGVTSLTWTGDRLVSSSQDGSFKVWQVPTTPPAGSKGVFAHAGAVSCATLAPDGTRLITGSEDKQVRAWNLTTGQLERTWMGPTLGILAVATGPQGSRVVAGSADRSIFVWETASNKVVQKITGLPAAVHAVGLSPDGKLVVSGLGDGTLRLHDLTTGKEVRSQEGHKGAILALAFSARGDQIITAGADGVILVRPLAGGPATQTISHGGSVQSLALTRDGARLAAGGSDKVVRVYNGATGKLESSITTPAEVRGLAFSADGKRVATAGGDRKARIYSLEGTLEEYLTQDGEVNGVVYSADGRRVITVGADKTARIWTPALLWQGRHPGGVNQALVSPRGDRIFSAGADGAVGVWTYADGKPAGSLLAHQGAVSGLALSSDVTRLVTVGADKQGRVWELARLPAAPRATPKELDRPTVALTLVAAPVSVALVPGSSRLVVGSEEADRSRVSVHDLATGTELLTLGENGSLPARQLMFLPDGRTLLAAGSDKAVHLAEVTAQAAFEAHKGGCSSLAFLDAGNQLMTAGADGTVKVWSLATGKLERTLGPLPGAIDTAQVARPTAQVVATSGTSLRVWNLADGKETLSLEMPCKAHSVSFNNDRTRLATAGEDGRVRIWDVQQKIEIQGFLHQGPATGVVFNPGNPAQVVSAGQDRQVGIHTVSSLRTVQVGGPVQGLAVAANSAHVLVASNDGKVRLVNPGNGLVDRTCEEGDKTTTALAISRASQLIAVGGADKKVRLFNYQDGKLLSAFTASAPTTALAFSPNNQALVSTGADGSITSWDVVFQPGQPLPPDFGKVLQTYQHGASASDVAFPSTGSIFFTAGADKMVRSWKLASDQALRTFPHPNTVNAVVYDKDGKLLATGGGDGKMRLFDLAKGNQLREINAHPSMTNDSAIYGVAFSPDGTQLVSAGKDGSLKLFTVADGKPVREFKAYKEKESPRGHQDAVLCVAFSPDGKQLASGGADRTIKIWNVADGSILREYSNPTLKPLAPNLPAPAHPGWVYSLRWSEDGKRLVSVGGAPRLKGYLAVWDAAAGRLEFGKELDVGTVFSLALAPRDGNIAVGTGGSVRSERDLNLGWILKAPK